MSIKEIKISQLKIGMFIVKIDISWIKSPFLKHSRFIEKNNDIKLLIQAGVKKLSIDTDKTIIEENTQGNSCLDIPIEDSKKAKQDAQTSVQETRSETKPEAKKALVTPLNQELETANLIKEKANQAFTNLSETIKQNKIFDIKDVSPIVDDSINSIIRNNQALLTMLHMHRNEKDLFSHSFSVMSLLISLAMSLNYSKEQLKQLGIAALLHDLGWARIPLHLLSKNKKYTENEHKVIQQHLPIIIKQLSLDPLNKETIKLISQHHEKGDGSGYPKGLMLDDLSTGSSLLILVDYYDELIHGLSDSPGVIPSLALKIIYKEAVQMGIYNKKEVEQLVNLLGIYPLTSAVQLSSDEKAIVVDINRSYPLKPKVKIFYDSKGGVIPTPYTLDLSSDEENRDIVTVIDLSDKKQDPLQLLNNSNF